MRASWLHVSDFHFKGGDPYDRDVVLSALVRSVRDFREREGRQPDLIFATGDVAHSGQENEYQAATSFFDALLAAACVDKRHLFVIPGNHDIDRNLGIGLARTLAGREEADAYFGPGVPKVHITQKQRAFQVWYARYFAGIRTFPDTSTYGPVEVVDVRGCSIAIIPINSALFCQGDDDHAKLWVGRRCLDSAAEELALVDAELRIGLIHHPLDWLHDEERSNIRTALQSSCDLILRGHLHETDVEHVVGVTGAALHIAAGAAYQTRRWPNRALYGTVWDGRVDVFPIRYEDNPRPVWTVDPSVFPTAPNYTKSFPIPRLAEAGHKSLSSTAPSVSPPERAPNPRPARAFRSNVPALLGLPFIGRIEPLDAIATHFQEPGREAVLVLQGPPGVGKSELAREFARRHRDRYPGGTFVVEAGRQALTVDLARVGSGLLGLDFPAGLSLDDQALRTFATLGAEPSLLIYDNVQSGDVVLPWLPAAGMPCHVLMTTNVSLTGPQWAAIDVLPLSGPEATDLVERVAGPEVARRYCARLVQLADGLPVQLVPACKTLAYEARRGRLDDASVTLAQETEQSFLGVYGQLEAPARLLLHAAARLNPQRIPRSELERQMEGGADWTAGEFRRRLDACLDLHLLQHGGELRMHQLLATFLRGRPVPEEVAADFDRIARAQVGRLIEIAHDLAANPNRADLASLLLTFPSAPGHWGEQGISVAEGETLGRALYEIGQFEAAQPWFERAVAAKEKGDGNGSIDHDGLGYSLHLIGYCLSSTGQFEAAQPWYERAVAERGRGDVHGRVNHDGLGSSLHQVGVCLSSTGQFGAAQSWYERAVAAREKGDVHGRVNHDGLGISLHQVGVCLSSTGQFGAAQSWFERAVAAREKGDVQGRVNHEGLGTSLHQVGVCLSSTGQFEAAQPWFERAVAEKEKGDVHGRVNHDGLGGGLHQVGDCLSSTGQFKAAQPWFERAVAAREKGDVHGRVNHEGLGISLHLIGYCLSSTGQFGAAQSWYERAVAEREKGDVHGRIDPDGLGTSLHQVGVCLSSTGQFEAAQPWYERAVAEREKGDVHGRVNHDGLGISLHQVGWCLSSTDQFEAAQPWFERAVAERKKGDIHGRINHEGLGTSRHQVGVCLSSTGQFGAAQPWYELAVAEREKGDVHGRVNHEGLGTSLHQVGVCLSSTGQFEAAQPWYERAVAERGQGDVHGRVNHEGLGTSLHQVGVCLSSTGQFEAAQPWYERAVAARERGDVHGRVNHEGRGTSLHQVGWCLSSTGQFGAAQPWYERAVAAREKGDVQGRVNHEGLGTSLHQVGWCLSSTGQFGAAQPWYERAVAAREKGDVRGRVNREGLGRTLRAGAQCLHKLGRTEEASAWERRATPGS